MLEDGQKASARDIAHQRVASRTEETPMTTRSTRAVPSLRRAFGEHVRALREARGLSQERLGRKASLSGKFIGEVERGEKSISLDSLWRVAHALALPMAALIPGASPRGNRRGKKS